MASGRKKLTHPLRNLARTRKCWYLQQLTAFFYFIASPPTLCSIKQTNIQTWARWFFGTLVHHLLGLLAFWIKSLFLDPTPPLSIFLACRAASSMSLDSVTQEMSPGNNHLALPLLPLPTLHPSRSPPWQWGQCYCQNTLKPEGKGACCSSHRSAFVGREHGEIAWSVVLGRDKQKPSA